MHQRYQGGITSELPEGATPEGNRVRQKRQAQAAYLANQIQLRQAAQPAERIVVFGDFNAYEFNDGLADVMNTVQGTPTADNETAVPGDGADLLDPDLINLDALEDAGEHYSFVPEGNAQSLDHVLVNAMLAARVDSLDLDHARINADFPETNRNDANSASRLAINDPRSRTSRHRRCSSPTWGPRQRPPRQCRCRRHVGFEVTVTNNGPDAAESVGVGFALDEEIVDLGVTAPAGWSCDTPMAEAGTTTVACNAASLGECRERRPSSSRAPRRSELPAARSIWRCWPMPEPPIRTRPTTTPRRRSNVSAAADLAVDHRGRCARPRR